jgi:hypothetical protein
VVALVSKVARRSAAIAPGATRWKKESTNAAAPSEYASRRIRR